MGANSRKAKLKPNKSKYEAKQGKSRHSTKPKEAGWSRAISTGKIQPPERFPNGTLAMSTVGPCLILGRYKDGDYKVTFPEHCEPQEVRSVKYTDIWLLSEWPDWVYHEDGTRAGKKPSHIPRSASLRGL